VLQPPRGYDDATAGTAVAFDQSFAHRAADEAGAAEDEDIFHIRGRWNSWVFERGRLHGSSPLGAGAAAARGPIGGPSRAFSDAPGVPSSAA